MHLHAKKETTKNVNKLTLVMFIPEEGSSAKDCTHLFAHTLIRANGRRRKVAFD